MSWWRVRFVVPVDFAEAVAWLLAAELDHPAEVQDQSTMSPEGSEGMAAVVMAFSAPPPPELGERISDVLGKLGLSHTEISTSRSDDQTWRHGWRAFFQPVQLSPRVSVRPPWEPQQSSVVDVVIEPGLAFGTGTHATTRGCVKMLDRVLGVREPVRVLDMGCGSAILSIAAAKLGHDVLGVEIDPDALKSAADNVRINGVGHKVELRHGSVEVVNETFPLVVANIIAPILVELSERLSVMSEHELILSGLLESQEESVKAAYSDFEVIERDTEGDWVVLRMVRR